MFIDTTISSKGHLLVKATATGSYGETLNRQFGRTYKSLDAALRKVQELHAKGMRGIEMYNLNTREVHYF